jgi:hypothetical protein
MQKTFNIIPGKSDKTQALKYVEKILDALKAHLTVIIQEGTPASISYETFEEQSKEMPSLKVLVGEHYHIKIGKGALP